MLSSDDVVRTGPRKKILNYIRISGSSNVDHVSELQLALLSEQQSVHTLKEKIKLDRENDLKNQQIIQVRRREQGVGEGVEQGTLRDRTYYGAQGNGREIRKPGNGQGTGQ